MALLLSHVKITLNSQVVPRIDEFIFGLEGWKKRKRISSKYEVKQIWFNGTYVCQTYSWPNICFS